MTGYGRGTAQRGPVKVTVELRAVNHRFLDVKVRTGGVPAAIEDAVTSQVRERLERGAVTVSIRVERTDAAGGVRIDRAVAAHVHAELTALAAALELPPPTLADVLAQPGVVQAGLDVADADGEATDQAAAGAAAAAAAL
ncbi:MAG TPA: YicC/YloC family endoribonuclease, partial [Kofleriaceae bacterium]|nr:YicC/YloC family endoribonuclease [Kofleriaceae bacterium]